MKWATKEWGTMVLVEEKDISYSIIIPLYIEKEPTKYQTELESCL